MAKYLRPRRGTSTNASGQNIRLQKGEIFMEFPNGSTIGKSPGRIIIGDGSSSYTALKYNSTVASEFKPFITDPSLYQPIFANTNPASSGWTFNSGTTAINDMGSGTGAVALPTIIGNIKKALCNHADSLTKLNNDKVNLNTTVTFTSGSLPSTYTANFPNGASNTGGSFLKLGYNEYYSNVSGGTTYTNNIYLSPQGPYININRNGHSASIDSNDYCELAPYNIGIGEKDSNLNDRNYIKMIENNYDLNRQFISGSSTYGWGNYTGTSFNGNNLNTFLNCTGVKFMSINGTFPANATTYYNYYYYDISFSTVGLSGKFLIGNPWVFLGANIPAFTQIANGNTIRINSNSADAKGKSFIVRVAYTDYELANTVKNA